MDINQVFGDVSNAASSAWDDFTKTGAPALQASIEQYGAQELAKMAQKDTAAANAGVQSIAARPVVPGSFAATLGSVFGGIGQNVVVEQYWPFIVIGLLGVGYLIVRK